MRADERDRRQATRRLHAAYTSGALSTSTFELRVGQALGARYCAELAALVGDLKTRRPRWMARLTASWMGATAPPAASADVALPAEEGESVVIGRSQECDAVVDDPTVSRRHALVTARVGEWRLLDLDSRNGVFLDGRRVRRAAVRAGDVIELGDSAVRLAVPRP